METFQLLMSSISMQDSQASIEQARRSTRLTQLAFIYVPLSFVTGIFGMNIKELNGSVLDFWAVFVCLIAVVLVTAIVFLFLHYFSAKPIASRNSVGSMA
jgi:Mg2+ and Co2+ transporter CorA